MRGDPSHRAYRRSRYGNAQIYGNGPADTLTHSRTNTLPNAYTNIRANGNARTNGNARANAHTNARTHGNGNANSDSDARTHADADACSHHYPTDTYPDADA